MFSFAATEAVAQTPDRPTKPMPFEVVSIHPTMPSRISGNAFTDDGYTMHAVTPNVLLSYISHTLAGLPDWGNSERYDIVAKVAEADQPAWKTMTFQQKSVSIRLMLEDRFHLKWHTETRMEQGYTLVIAKGGVKMKEATPDETYPGGPHNADGTPRHEVYPGPSVIVGQAGNMEQIVHTLGLFARAPIEDKTGLTGLYDFMLNAAPEPPPGAAVSDPPVSDAPSLFVAVQKQLGLKLVPGKVPVEYVVVDHIERPAAN